MLAEIISVGSELLAGTILNTNSVFLARNLGLMGFDVHRQSVVGDSEADIMDAVRLAGSRSHVTILTGGLGPTDDDKTKEAVAAAFNLQLVESPEVLRDLKQFFAQRGTTPTENNFKQAKIIKGCEILHNPNGTAPGILLQTATQAIALLPGPPSEMEPMFENELKPHLQALSADRSVGASLHVFGIGESALEEKIHDLLYGENPSAALYAKTGEVCVDIIARAPSEAQAKQLLDEKIAAIRERVGDNIYSEDGRSMAQTVVDLLKETDAKVAVAESCTGGLMSARITEIEGASKVFDYGMAAYADWVKKADLSVDGAILRKFTAVSSVTAAEMAKSIRERGDADIGVGITGIAGPSPGDYINKPVGLVYIAVADKNSVLVKKFNFGGMRGRAFIRELTVLSAFDMVRRFVTGLPIDGAKQFDKADLADDEREGKPQKKSSLAVKRGIATSALALVSAGLLFLGFNAVRTRHNSSIYNELRSVFSSTDADGTRIILGLDPLVERNPDTVGWVTTDSAVLDCVVVAEKEKEAGYYETHDFEGARNTLGCLYVDSGIDLSALPDNVVIHGSSSDESHLFGPLRHYIDITYLEQNNTLTFHTLDGNNPYRIVSVYYANSNPDMGNVQTDYLTSHFADSASFTDFVVNLKMRSIYNCDIDIVSGDTFLTLVTDVGNWDGAQLVVVARRVREGEETAVTSALFSRNVTADYPEAWYTVTGTKAINNPTLDRDVWANWLVACEKNAGLHTASGGIAAVNTDANDPFIDDSGQVQITVIMNGDPVTGSPQMIISRMVAYQMSSTAKPEAVKAMTVACSSWLWYSLQNGGTPTIMGKVPSDTVSALVAECYSEVLMYNGAVAYTPFFDIAATNTYSSKDILGLDLPYLVSVESKYDASVSNYSREIPYSREAIKSRLEHVYGIKLSDNIQNWVVIENTLAGGAAGAVVIDGKVRTTGYDLYTKCLTSLCSPNFTISAGENFVYFTCYGNGDGVGMSRAGCEGYAAQLGWDYKQILAHYYKGTTAGTVDWQQPGVTQDQGINQP